MSLIDLEPAQSPRRPALLQLRHSQRLMTADATERAALVPIALGFGLTIIVQALYVAVLPIAGAEIARAPGALDFALCADARRRARRLASGRDAQRCLRPQIGVCAGREPRPRRRLPRRLEHRRAAIRRLGSGQLLARRRAGVWLLLSSFRRASCEEQGQGDRDRAGRRLDRRDSQRPP